MLLRRGSAIGLSTAQINALGAPSSCSTPTGGDLKVAEVALKAV